MGLGCLTFSEYGLVAYQIKGNEAYNNMLPNILPDTHQGHFLSFLKIAHEIYGNGAWNVMQANVLPGQNIIF